MLKHKLFLESRSSGNLRVVEVLGENPSMVGGIYIRYEHGGTDTTTDKFLFDIPSGLSTMPLELTAENGAKGLMIGEFFEVSELECSACDQDDEDCEVCSGNGSYTYRVPVGWDTIKEIYAKAVEHFGN